MTQVRLAVRNSSDAAMTLIIEPMGACYPIGPRSALSVHLEGEGDSPFTEISFGDGLISLFVFPWAKDEPQVFDGDAKLEPSWRDLAVGDPEHRRGVEGYLAEWPPILSKWLGWPEERVERWMRAWQYEAYNDFWFTHDSAFSHVLQLLIPEPLRQRLDRDALRQLEWDMESAVVSHPDYRDRYGQYDWEAARLRVAGVLRSAGGEIAGPDEVTEYEERVLRLLPRRGPSAKEHDQC